jgi:hypothetical protein
MDPATAGGEFGRLMQYGAVGIIAAGLLTLLVVLFRQFVNHALEQNKKLLERHDLMMERHDAMQTAHLKAMHELVSAIHAMKAEVIRDIGQVFNEVSAITEGSRAHRRPRS